VASKEAGKLAVGDVWATGRNRFRVLATQAGIAPSVVRVTAKNLNTNKVEVIDFYRVNRLEVEMLAEPQSVGGASHV
jgi:hypothetical protein